MSKGKGRTTVAKRHANQLAAARARQQSPPLSALSDHRRKLAWAECHIQEGKSLSEGWVNNKSYEVSVKPDGQGRLELVGEQVKPLPDVLGLVIGDALESMRSSLDNLAFALACKNSRALTADEQEDVSFPIHNQPPVATHRSITHMSPAAQAAIISLCGYPAMRAKEQDALWLLNKTNNRDKHRAITVAAADVSKYSLYFATATIVGPAQIGIGGPKRTTKVGDRNVFAKFGVGSQLQGNVGTTLQIVFGEGLEVADREVWSTLRWFHDHIRDTVFQALEPLL
jgi:hypothetical protein